MDVSGCEGGRRFKEKLFETGDVADKLGACMTSRAFSPCLRAIACTVLSVAAAASLHAQQPHRLFRIQAGPGIAAPVSGRLLLLMKQGSGDKQIDAGEFTSAHQTWIAAQEVHDLAPGATIEMDADRIAYPKPFSQAPAGTWEVQAVLDVDHTFNYGGRSPADWQSPVVSLAGTAEPTLTLSEHPAPTQREKEAAALSGQPGVAERFSIESTVLTKFWGKPTYVQGWVILPPGYDAHAKHTWPTAYWTFGFGGNMQYALATGMSLHQRMVEKKMPPMIWVMLDESLPEGTHEFADSVNDGPWGTALTTEFIPALEQKYRMDASRGGRFLNGHSSGGWATLQLEINYPQIFGGTWSTSPDPSDFHDFTGANLYAPHANVYRKPDGTLNPLVRMNGKVVATFEQFAKEEAVIGPYGGQIASFEWVFSPKGPSGAPEPMFDRKTGDVYPKVVEYWHDHYDLAHLAEQEWPTRGSLLKGRIHLWVGTADTFYLNGSARLLEARLDKLGADEQFHFLPGRSHFDLYAVGKDRAGLFDEIGAEMYAVARPGVRWRAAP